MSKLIKAIRSFVEQASLGGIIGGIAVLFSTALSGSGRFFSLEATTLPVVIRFLVASLATLFITALAFRFWMLGGKLRKQRRLRQSYKALPQAGHPAPYLLGAATLMAASVITAMIALVYLNHRDAVQSLLNQETFSGTLEPVDALAAELAAIAILASQAEQMAAERSAIETERGGTCDNAPAGYGPRAILRSDHAGIAKQLSEQAEALSLDASRIVQQMVSAADQALIESLFAEAKALSFDRSRLEIASEADRLSRGYGGQGFLVEGRTISCPDAELAALFGQIADRAGQGIDLPGGAPTRQEATVFDAFGVVLPALITGEFGREVGLTRATLTPFLLFAALIDLVSMAGALSFGASRAVRITSDEVDQLHRTAWVLRNFFWEWPAMGSDKETDLTKIGEGQAFVYVPLGGNPERTHQAEYLVALLGLDVDPAYQFAPLTARRGEFSDWINQMILAGGGATHYAQYPVRDQPTLDRIKAMKREAVKALGMRKLDTVDFPEFGSSTSHRVVTLKALP